LREFIRCTTARKLLNLMLVKAELWMRRTRLAGMPIAYFIDPINICNLRCPLCPTGRGILARPQGRMPLPDLKKIVDEIAPYAYRVELYNWGEPLLHPGIVEMVDYVSRKGITVGLSSNLNRLDEDTARRLIGAGLSQLVVSLDGSTQEAYAAYRRRGDLDQVLRNLELLREAKQELGRSNPFVIARMLVGRHNEDQVTATRQLAYAHGANSFVAGPLFVDTNDPAQLEQWVPEDPAYRLYGADDPKPENTWHCRDLWESMVINWDGGVAPCCWLHDAQLDFGDASTKSIREIWNNASYVSARRVIGKRKGLEEDEIVTICHRCRGHPHYMEY
jgi:MoaA/NifB/PqqE/SkfB family radical SAM enzyme